MNLRQTNSADSGSGKNDDFVLTLYEVRELLGKSSRTLTRYVQKRILHPRAIKSCQGTMEYRFSRAEVYALRESEKKLRPYLFMGDGQNTSELPNYAAANFANYGVAAPLAAPAQMPFLVPGVSFPLAQNQFVAPANPQIGNQVWPQPMPQNSGQNPPGQTSSDDAEFLKAIEEIEKKKNQKNEMRERENRKKEKDLLKESEIKEAQKHANQEIISLLKETTEMLRGQLKAKDDQIKNLDDKIGQLLERNRETNILLKGLQDKIMLLEKPKEKEASEQYSRAESQSPVAEKIEKNEITKNQELFFEEKNINEVDLLLPKTLVEPQSPSFASYDLPVPPAKSEIGETDGKEKKRNKNEKKGLFGKIFG